MIVGDNSFSNLIVFQSSPVASYKECCSQCTARVSPRRTCTIEALISANFLAIGWNSNDIPSRLAKFASCFPVSTKISIDAPMPVILMCGGPSMRVARMWNKAGHCRPCMMSRSTMWTVSRRWKASRMAWLDVKCANFMKGDMLLNTWKAPWMLL